MVLNENQVTQPSQQQIAAFAHEKAQKALVIARKLEVMRLAAVEPVISEMIKSAKRTDDDQFTSPIKKEMVSV